MIRLTFDESRIPAALKAHRGWVCWFVGERDGKPTKILLNPATGRAAKSNDPATWGTFHEAAARARRCGLGVGYVFSDADTFAGVDLDDCCDSRTGAIAAWAQRLISYFATYAEASPSGCGVKLVLVGKFTGRGRRRGDLEVYCRRRFFALTGERLDASPYEPQPRQVELDRFMAEMFPEPAPRPATVHTPLTLDDEKILTHARAARNGGRFEVLWSGNWQSRHGSRSEADLALCAMLSFWCGGDPARVDALFRRSGLVRDKWIDRDDYRAWTLAKATNGDVYDWAAHEKAAQEKAQDVQRVA